MRRYSILGRGQITLAEVEVKIPGQDNAEDTLTNAKLKIL